MVISTKIKSFTSIHILKKLFKSDLSLENTFLIFYSKNNIFTNVIVMQSSYFCYILLEQFLHNITQIFSFKVLEPPAEYLQEDTLNDDRMPPDVLYMLQSIRVFGHFEKPVFLKLCKHTEIVNVSAGTYLFKIGEMELIPKPFWIVIEFFNRRS